MKKIGGENFCLFNIRYRFTVVYLFYIMFQ